jgi:hypothetical protein
MFGGVILSHDAIESALEKARKYVVRVSVEPSKPDTFGPGEEWRSNSGAPHPEWFVTARVEVFGRIVQDFKVGGDWNIEDVEASEHWWTNYLAAVILEVKADEIQEDVDSLAREEQSYRAAIFKLGRLRACEPNPGSRNEV